MQSFGSMGLGGFFGSGPLMAGNPFDAFFGFSDCNPIVYSVHQQLNKAGAEGTFVMQAQMTSIEMGPDGRPIIENYFENNLGQHMNGQTVLYGLSIDIGEAAGLSQYGWHESHSRIENA